MEAQQQHATEIEQPNREDEIRASTEAISFMLNIGETFSVIWSLFYMFWWPARNMPERWHHLVLTRLELVWPKCHLAIESFRSGSA